MKKQIRYSPEIRERAVRLVYDHQVEYESQWAAMVSIAAKIGCTPETLRTWVRWSETDQGTRGGLSISDRERLKELERENRELKRANEILRKASGGARPPTEVMGYSLINTRSGTESSQSAGKFRLLRRVTISTKRVNEILTGY